MASSLCAKGNSWVVSRERGPGVGVKRNNKHWNNNLWLGPSPGDGAAQRWRGQTGTETQWAPLVTDIAVEV